MNKEEEYLQTLLNDIDRLGIKGNYSVEDLFSCQDLRIIKHSYNQLQKENKEQEEYIKYWQNEYDKKMEIIDKAIEHLEKLSFINETTKNRIFPLSNLEMTELYIILKGDSNESN